MESHRKGAFGRSLMSTLAAAIAAAVPSLVSGPALADRAPEGAAIAPTKGAEAPRTEPKHAKKAHAAKKAHPKQEGEKQEGVKPAEAKGKKAKKSTASRAAVKVHRTANRGEAPGRRCLGTPIELDRGGLEPQSLALLDCRERPVEAAQVALSVLARPWGAQKPDLGALRSLHSISPGKAVHGGHGRVKDELLAPGVRLLDKGLLARVTAVARRFPGRPISLVSGYRPQSRGSLHQSARALDLRVAGVPNEELVAFCKTLPDTGCGYYPNSSFVHVDVRNPGTGGVSWIDASGPGEAPRYVHQWPPSPEESGVAVPPADAEPHDGSTDPWAEPADEHAGAPLEKR